MSLGGFGIWLKEQVAVLTPLQDFIVRILAGAVIIAIGMLAGRLLGKFVGKTLKRIKLGKATQLFGLKIPPEVIGEFATRYLIYFVAAVIALNQMGITTWVMNILLVVGVLILLLALTLGLKDFFPNLIAGLLIFSKQLLKKGQHLRVGDVEGTVKEIGLFDTKLVTHSNNIVIIPNSHLIKNKVTTQKCRGQQVF